MPDAPWAWYEELVRVLTGELGFQHRIIDLSLFIHRDEQGSMDALVCTHVELHVGHVRLHTCRVQLQI